MFDVYIQWKPPNIALFDCQQKAVGPIKRRECVAPSSAAFGKLCTVCKQPPNTAKEVGLIGNSGQGSCSCARNKCFGKSLFARSYRTKIVVGGRKIKQLDLKSLGYVSVLYAADSIYAEFK